MLRRQRQTAVAAPAGRGGGLISRHPRESVALIMSGLAVLWIVVNALWMQPGPHPAPIFSTRPMPAPATVTRMPALPAAATPLPVAAPSRNDPIADLIAPSKQVVSVQRALSDFGYGQIRPNGVAGPDTRAAIERFERKYKMPVTGQISDRLLSALSTMTGQTIR